MLRYSMMLCAALMFMGTGCATVVRGDKQKMKIDTDPAAATINVDGKEYTSPATIVLKRKEPHKVMVTHAGYQPIEFTLNSQWDGASLGNIILPGGSVGFGMDTINGADRHFNSLAKIKLSPVGQSPGTVQLMKEYRGKIVTPSEYDAAVKAEREDKTRFFQGN
jgi:hypothetical protein